MSSRQAADVAKCLGKAAGMPLPIRVTTVSDSDFSTGSDGLGAAWHVDVYEASEPRICGYYVSGVISPMAVWSAPASCVPGSTDPPDSALVVPDSFVRFAQIDPEPNAIAKNLRYVVKDSCLDAPETFVRTHLTKIGQDGEYLLIARYSWAGTFERVCGPCLETGDPACALCVQ